MRKVPIGNSKRPPLASIHDILSFGQYKGETVDYVLKNDPGYLIWMDDNQICDIEDEILERAVDFEFDEKVHNEVNDLGFSWDDVMGDD